MSYRPISPPAVFELQCLSQPHSQAQSFSRQQSKPFELLYTHSLPSPARIPSPDSCPSSSPTLPPLYFRNPCESQNVKITCQQNQQIPSSPISHAATTAAAAHAYKQLSALAAVSLAQGPVISSSAVVLPMVDKRSFETFYGFIKERNDAVALVEACVAGVLKPLKMVPADAKLRSGSVLVFAESSGITRWRDGENWSPSRIHGSFLLYREVQPKTMDKVPFLAQYQKSRFGTTSFRPKTQPVQHGFAKRTVSIVGSDGNRYRVISYFFPKDVTHLCGEDDESGLAESESAAGFRDRRCAIKGVNLKTPSEDVELARFSSSSLCASPASASAASSPASSVVLPSSPSVQRSRKRTYEAEALPSSKSARVDHSSTSTPASPPPCSIQFLIS
ncbi:hypothetical protein CcCBS67573_g09977 [Chytriomyces confervae]|uniref:Uncharacterized protein n=1 Tax=Chytriomyces confervae TaxID=246404 RepID=A0A507DL73_9FUNG|nr:hypothetical protein CcCBS67573_g09977 [Chytriomyces confervae]